MDISEAKQILQICGQSAKASDNPHVIEALNLARENEELKTFLEKERAFDRVFSGKLKEIEVPDDLLSRILSGAPLLYADSATSGPLEVQEIVWWRQPVVWSVAACLVVLLVVGTMMFRPQLSSPVGIDTNERVALDDFVQSVTRHSGSIEQLDYYNQDINAVFTYLQEHRMPSPKKLPQRIQSLESLGCLTFLLKDAQVGLVCFKGSKLYHLYVGDCRQLAIEAEQHEPVMRQLGKHAAATWTRNGQVYVLTVEGDTTDLDSLL